MIGMLLKLDDRINGAGDWAKQKLAKTPLGKGLVVETNLLARTLKVKMDNTPDDAAPQSFKVKEVRVVKGNYINNKGNKKGKEKDTESEELKKLEDQ